MVSDKNVNIYIKKKYIYIFHPNIVRVYMQKRTIKIFDSSNGLNRRAKLLDKISNPLVSSLTQIGHRSLLKLMSSRPM